MIKAFDQYSSTEKNKFWLVEVQDSDWMGVRLAIPEECLTMVFGEEALEKKKPGQKADA